MKVSIKPLLVGLVCIFSTNAFAQQMQMPQLPTDPAVRIGKLENGLTYYIRHNEFPKGQVNMHIAQKVGAVQEDDNQRGLAHFLEHMCFNGTKHFPGSSMTSWLESIGVKFGINLNAGTGQDITIYDINSIPTARTSAVDSCLLILSDWADGLTLDPKEIDKERGVIHEEWRGQTSPFERIFDQNGETFFGDSKYGKRFPIGKMEVVDNFPYQVLRDYYEKWYRPDLQGIIIVGDVDVDRTEAKIKELFAPIQMPANPAKFEYYPVADTDEPLLISQKDKEMMANLALIFVKYDLLPREIRNTDASLINDYMQYAVGSMMTQRFNELTLKPDAPLGSCGASMGKYLSCSTKGALTLQAIANNSGVANAIKCALTEMKRVADYGFTAGEYDRVRTEYLSKLEKAYNNRSKQQNEEYCQAYIENFIQNSPIPGIEYEYNKLKQILPMVPVEAINQTIKELLNGKNLVILATAPDKEGSVIPGTAEMQQVIDEVKASNVEAYIDNTVNEPLISQLPTAGKIVSEKENPALGYTEWTLSNGARVLLKPTTHKDNEILMSAISQGGASLYPDKDYINIVPISELWGMNGVSKFSINDLQKVLSGKQARANIQVNDYDEEIVGQTTPKDLETMMQLVYLNFTQPRYDKQGFEGIRQLAVSSLENIAQNPEYVFADSLLKASYNHHPKAMMLGKEVVTKMDYDRMSQIVKERFANAADFDFIFCGNFDKETLRKYVELYIASLPANGQKEKAVNDKKEYVKGVQKKVFAHKTENNQAMLGMLWTGKLDNTQENRIKLSIAGQLMANNLLNRVREDEGAAYNPYARGVFEQTYDGNFLIQTSFSLNPDKQEKSEKVTISCLEDLSKNIEETELNKMKEFMMKQWEQDNQDNNYWIRTLKDWTVNAVDMNTRYKETVQKLTTKDMQDFIAGLLKQGNRCEVIMMPEK